MLRRIAPGARHGTHAARLRGTDMLRRDIDEVARLMPRAETPGFATQADTRETVAMFEAFLTG